MPKILVVDDDSDIVELVTFSLTKVGMQCMSARRSKGVIDLILAESPHLVILDILLPGMSGIEILKTLKANPKTSCIPIIMLTARGEEADRILGLELGAEDYVTKPFSVRELVLRVERVLGRIEKEEAAQQLLRCSEITLDMDRYEVRVMGSVVQLTPTEFNLLAFLIRNRGRVLSRDRLLEQVWGYRYGGTTRTVDTHIQRLRDKLGSEGECIETVRGVGYRATDVS